MSDDNTHHNDLQQDTEKSLIHTFLLWFDTLTTGQRKVFWKLHWHILHFDPASPKQKRLAEIAGFTRQFVNKTIGLCIKKGYVFSQRRSRASIYKLHPSLHNLDLKTKLYYMRKVTSQMTSQNNLKRPPDKDYREFKNPSYKTNIKYIRNTNRKIETEKIDPIFEDFDWPKKDKIAFSRYTSEEIDQAFEQLSSFHEHGGELRNPIRFFQAKLHSARNGSLKVPPSSAPIYGLEEFNLSDNDLQSFRKYSESQLVMVKERVNWYMAQGHTIFNLPAFMHTTLTKNKKTSNKAL